MTGLDHIDQQLFDLTHNFTLDDWAVIRAGDHWEIRDNLPNRRERQIYLLQCVREYLN